MATRRTFLLRSAMALAGARHALGAAASAPLRTVAQGTLRGEEAGGVQVFRGVPYAEPPVGGLRFRPARPPRPWTGVRDATRFADAAVQPDEGSFAQSEDCLYLNVWVPETPGPHPVFVWIHGGGFTGGRTSEPLYDGTSFAQAGVVCITVAYRLGVLGFLDVSKFFGPVYTGSANHALLDIIAALRWVQTNVAAFGGDPGRVTVGGESAGAKLADVLLGTPLARPLFQQVISESGGAERVWPAEHALAVADGYAEQWRSKTGQPVSAMQTAPARTLIEVQTAFQAAWPEHFPLRMEQSPNLLPQRPLAAIAKGSGKGKRLLIGTNRDESALFLGPDPVREVTAKDLGNLPLEQFLPIEAQYRKLFPQEDPARTRIRAVTAEEYWIPSLRVADAQRAGGGGDTYLYELDFPGSGRFKGLAYHSFDLRFVWEHFGNAAASPAERALADSMHAAWVSFIAGQAPAGPGLPPWTPYSTNGRPTMVFDRVSRMEAGTRQAEIDLWNGLLTE